LGRAQIWDGTQWVEMTGGATGGGEAVSHSDLVGVTSGQHHARYTDSEAIAATQNTYLRVAGGTVSGQASFSVDSSITFAVKQHVLVPSGSNNSALYFSTGLGTAATGAIEAAWPGSLPTIAIGVTRDGDKAKAVFAYDGSIKLSTVGTDRLTITGTSISTLLPLRAQNGAVIDQYNPTPESGRDLYWYQTRNIRFKDTAGPPSNSEGKDGDVTLRYTF
jgi:hypothetical protein